MLFDPKIKKSWKWHMSLSRTKKAHSRILIPHLNSPKDNHPSLLRTSRSTQWNKCGTQWNHPPLLGHHPQCTKRGKEDLNSPIKSYQEMNNRRTHCYVGHNFLKQYQQCVIRSRDRGDSVAGHPTTLVHHSRERDTLRQGSSEVNTSLHWNLKPLSRGPLARG